VKSYTLVVTPDNNVKLKGPDVMPLIQKYAGELKAAADGTPKRTPSAARAPAPAPAPAPVRPTAQSAAERQMAQRYGNRPGASPAPPPVAAPTAAPTAAPAAPPSPAVIAAEIAKLPIVVLADGTWKGENDKYQLTLTSQAGGFRFNTGKKSATVEASIKDGRLYLAEENGTMVMEKF